MKKLPVYKSTGQPVHCPKCKALTRWFFKRHRQIHTCPDCFHTFIVVTKL
jgi:formamidopyrimidine-DNA glycosylase